MNQIDLSINNSGQKTLVLDEMASLKEHLKNEPLSEEILQKIQNYESRIFQLIRDNKD